MSNPRDVEEKLQAVYAKWLRCWMKEETEPMFLMDALRHTYALALEDARSLVGEHRHDVPKSRASDYAKGNNDCVTRVRAELSALANSVKAGTQP